jgi:hypothetical protein
MSGLPEVEMSGSGYPRGRHEDGPDHDELDGIGALSQMTVTPPVTSESPTDPSAPAGDQRHEAGVPLRAVVAAHEEPVFTSDCLTAEFALTLVVVQPQAAVLEEARQRDALDQERSHVERGIERAQREVAAARALQLVASVGDGLADRTSGKTSSDWSSVQGRKLESTGPARAARSRVRATTSSSIVSRSIW